MIDYYFLNIGCCLNDSRALELSPAETPPEFSFCPRFASESVDIRSRYSPYEESSPCASHREVGAHTDPAFRSAQKFPALGSELHIHSEWEREEMF